MTRPVPSTGDLDAIVNGQPEVIAPETDPAAEALKERLSTWLSAAAMVMFTVGLTLGLWPYWGPWSLCAGATALGAFLAYSDSARRPDPVKVVKPVKPTPPGPTSAGRLHTKGPGASA